MPTKTIKKPSRAQKDQKVTLQLSPEITNAIIELSKKKSEKKGFWNWLKEHGTSLVTLFTIMSAIAGGLWTLNQYIDQQRQSEKARQQEVIARFAGDLADPAKRNSAVYALAVLADDEVVPLLVYQLQDEALNQSDQSYRNALIQALTTIGEPSLDPVIELNRRVAQTKIPEDIEKISNATTPIISSFIVNNPDSFRKNPNLLNEIFLTNINLSGLDLHNLTFNKVGLSNSLLCVTNLESAKFDGGIINDTYWAGSAALFSSFSHIEFHNSNFVHTEFKAATLSDLRVFNSNFSGTFLTGAKIEDSLFQSDIMGVVYLDQGEISNTVFIDSDLNNAKFFLTKFNSAGFYGSNLENADFRNADLSGVDFFIGDENTKPNTKLILGDTGWDTRGSFVRSADFEGATNLNEAARIYLCKWGGENIPGGCDGIEPEDLSMVPQMEYTFHNDVGKCGN